MRRPPPERTDVFTSGARGALDDIRSKLIEEGWFGRPSGDRQQAYTDMRNLYGREPEPPKGWSSIDWSDRIKATSHQPDPCEHEVER